MKSSITENDIYLSLETVSGNLVNPTDPNIESIDIKDIAWALSRTPRFAGHTITAIPFNVAQHSVYVADLLEEVLKGDSEGRIDLSEIGNIDYDFYYKVFADLPEILSAHPKEFLLKALLHDAHEAYIGDIPSPIKRIPELNPIFKMMEMKLDNAIRIKYKIPELSNEEKDIIKLIDKLSQAIEGYQFMPSRGRNWNLPQPSLLLLQRFPKPLSPRESYEQFLNRFNDLIKG